MEADKIDELPTKRMNGYDNKNEDDMQDENLVVDGTLASRSVPFPSLCPDEVDGGGDKTSYPTGPLNLHHESERYKTFANWPDTARISKEKLAKAGFYYSGIGTLVKCFSCNGTVDNWDFNDSAIQKHRNLGLDCAFLKGTSNNVPVNPPTTSSREFQSLNSARASYDSNYASMYQAPSDSISKTSYPSSTVTNSSSINPRDKTWQNFSSLVSEQERLNTFKGWPSPFVKDTDLARAGFFYLKEADKVRCIFCNGVVGEWEPGDVPITEHHRHFPTCPFIRGFNVGNIPIENGLRPNREMNNEIERMIQSPDPNWGGDVAGCYRYEMSMFTAPEKSHGVMNQLSELGINHHSAPVHPNYATTESRLRTFGGWPKNITQSPESMAEAGFYYAGVSDHVRCFCCDGGLRNWEPSDDPWVEHSRWFGKCNFVTIVKGPEFIAEAREKFPAVIAKPGTSKQTSSGLPGDLVSQIGVLIRTPVVSAVLDIGVDIRAVRRALIRRLRDVGRNFENSDSLYEACLEEDVNKPEEDILGLSVPKPTAPQAPVLVARCSEPEVNVGRAVEHPVLPKVAENPAFLKAAASACKINGLVNHTNACDPVSMEEENRQLKEMRLCKICLDNEVGVVFLPCGHLVCCPHCAPSLTDCPLCRKKIQGTVRTFLS